MTHQQEFYRIHNICINYAKSCSEGIDVQHDGEWQEGIAYDHYCNIKQNMRHFEKTVRPLDVDEWGKIIDEVTEILWI